MAGKRVTSEQAIRPGQVWRNDYRKVTIEGFGRPRHSSGETEGVVVRPLDYVGRLSTVGITRFRAEYRFVKEAVSK